MNEPINVRGRADHRDPAGYLQSTREMSERRECRVIWIDWTSVHYWAMWP
jgi:hypothetical protein